MEHIIPYYICTHPLLPSFVRRLVSPDFFYLACTNILFEYNKVIQESCKGFALKKLLKLNEMERSQNLRTIYDFQVYSLADASYLHKQP